MYYYSPTDVIDFVKNDIFFEHLIKEMDINLVNKFDLVIDHLYMDKMIVINESFNYENDIETFAHVCVRKIDNELFIVKMIRDFETRELLRAESFNAISSLIKSIH